MRSSTPWYSVLELVDQVLPDLRPAQRRGLALWVYGVVLAGNGRQNAVLRKLAPLGSFNTLRQRLREVFLDGAQKAKPCRTQINLSCCFAPLLRAIVAKWTVPTIALALDATTLRDRLTVVVISVVYRSGALPVAWTIFPGNRAGRWNPHIAAMLRQLAPATPPSMTVLLMVDRGLWSTTLWDVVRKAGWHPMMRIRDHYWVQTQAHGRQPCGSLVRTRDRAWVGAGTLGITGNSPRRHGTLIVLWLSGYDEKCIVFTDLPPEQAGAHWYRLRFWIESGFRSLKSTGLCWEHTRRTDPVRAARHWLVLALAMLFIMEYGTRYEDAELARRPPDDLDCPPFLYPPPRQRPRIHSIFIRGLDALQYALWTHHFWTQLWLAPEALPDPPPTVLLLEVPDAPDPDTS